MQRILVVVFILHVLGWGLLTQFGDNKLALTSGVLAYILGLRHAFDADHLVAIDATTRKLIHEHKDSHGVGFFFSLGHSTIVFAATALSIAGLGNIANDLMNEQSVLKLSGAFIGTLFAAIFLIIIGIYNLYSFFRILYMSHSHTHGLFSRFIKPVNSAKSMYLVGLLFGLGFDTATSVAFLSLSITSNIASNLIFAALAIPIIFASGMILGDTLSGFIMSQSMQWAVSQDRRRIYNLVLTGVATTFSLLIGVSLLFEL